MTAGWAPPRRFWSAVSVVAGTADFGVWLDDKPVLTPARRPLAAPAAAAAEACAEEWRAVGERIDPRAMPVTRLLNTAIDRVAPNAVAVADEVARYAETDLLCHRAAAPAALAARQAQAWNPWLDWLRARHGVLLVCVEGVMHAAQPADDLDRLARKVRALSPFELAALHDLTALSGSVVLGLAVLEGAVNGDIAWTASRVDEDWQAEQWGVDAEAAEAAALKRADFLSAARLAALLSGR